jgi:hypothetical protein
MKTIRKTARIYFQLGLSQIFVIIIYHYYLFNNEEEALFSLTRRKRDGRQIIGSAKSLPASPRMRPGTNFRTNSVAAAHEKASSSGRVQPLLRSNKLPMRIVPTLIQC